jgi:hypothetical protein
MTKLAALPVLKSSKVWLSLLPDPKLATSPYDVFRTEPGHNFGMGLPCFRFCYLRKIQLQPIKNCLPKYFSELLIIYGFNNRMAEIKVLFRRNDAQVLISRQMFEPTLYRDKPRSCYGFCKYLSRRALTETNALDVNHGGGGSHTRLAAYANFSYATDRSPSD